MNEKEISEIRRRFRHEKNNITHIHGCYVNGQHEIISQFTQSLSMTAQEETETFLAVLKRTLSGTPGKNLLDINFDTKQVVDSDEHRLLMALKNSSLKDETAVQSFFERVIQSVPIEDNYLILLAHDTYDIPFHGGDGETLKDGSTDMFSYFLCSICPVKMTKPALSYHVTDSQFHNRKLDWIVSPPELGFMFPAYEDGGANIYSSLYYTRDIAENHPDFVDAIFKQELPMPAAAQKETFESLLENTLSDQCSYEVVQAVHDQLCGMVEEHKANKEPGQLVISKNTVKHVLESCGVSDEHVDAFDTRYDSEFGSDTTISPRNLVDSKQFELRTPEVRIQVNPDHTDLIETRTINGARYILIRADSGVEVNGVSIHIS